MMDCIVTRAAVRTTTKYEYEAEQTWATAEAASDSRACLCRALSCVWALVLGSTT